MNREITTSLIVFVIAVLVAVGGLYLYRSHKEAVTPAPPPGSSTPPTAEAMPPKTPPPPPRLDLPPLSASDELVRQLAGRVSAHPQLARWLVNDNLIARFVAATDNIARGESPSHHVTFLDPGRGFEVEEVEVGKGDGQEPVDELVIDPASYQRFNLLTGVIASLDTEGSAELYDNIKPLIDQAYGELGYPGTTFEDSLARAIRVLLATPIPEGEIRVTPRVDTYAFADPSLQNLSPPQKQLLRMGPENARQIQAKLRALAAALDLEV